MSKTRIYTVSNGDTDRLVRAANRSQAIRHVAQSVYASRVATQDDIVLAMRAGLQIENATTSEQED